MSDHIKKYSWVLLLTFYQKKKFLPFFIEKMDRNEACGTPENGDYAYFFSARFLFSTLIDASLLWAQNLTN